MLPAGPRGRCATPSHPRSTGAGRQHKLARYTHEDAAQSIDGQEGAYTLARSGMDTGKQRVAQRMTACGVVDVGDPSRGLATGGALNISGFG